MESNTSTSHANSGAKVTSHYWGYRELTADELSAVAGGDRGDYGDGGDRGYGAGPGESNTSESSGNEVAAWSGKDFMCSAAAFGATAVVGALATPLAGAFAGFATQQLCNYSTSNGTALAGLGGWGGGSDRGDYA